MAWNDWEQRDEGAPEWTKWIWVALLPLNIIIWTLLYFWPEDDEPMTCTPDPPALRCER